MACEIKLTCPGCTAEIAIWSTHVHAEVHSDSATLNRLIYTCPGCRHPQRHDLSTDQWQFLMASVLPGDLRQVVLPAGIASRFGSAADPLTEDHLIDFGRQIEAWAP